MGETKREVKDAAQSRWTKRFARLGLVAKGALYVLVGLIALNVSIGAGEHVEDRSGALSTLAGTWYGKLLVGVLAIGLLGYAVWRFARAVLGRPLEGGEADSWPKRLGYTAGGVWYVGLFGLAVSALVGANDESGSGKEDRYTARVLDLPLGNWLVIAVGLGVVAAGVFNLWRGLTGRFRKDLKLRKMGEAEEKSFLGIGAVGHAARGVVFGLIGFFLVRAAWEYDPEETVGLDGALAKILRQDYGGTLLAIVAAGLIAYGLYCWVEARYREV